MFRCRICSSELSHCLLELKNVPAAAQKMPATREELAADKGIDLSICQCPECGVLQHTATPVSYFREVIRASGISEEMKQFRLEQFHSWILRNNLTGKKVFEAGCGKGEYLELMRDSGADVAGTEFGDETAAKCREAGLKVFKLFFETGEEKIPDSPYDGFFVLNFLEHIPDIPRFLAGIRNNLTENAPGIIEVPNLDMILANGQLTEFSTEHIYYFTESNLRNLLQNHGFEVVSCKKIWYNYIISAEVRKRPLLSLEHFAETGKQLSCGIRQFISCCGKTVFWGAGHQALTTLALSGLTTEEICYVIDSSPEKQNRYTFTTHIPIVGPDILNDESLKGVIVACGGYSDEVISIIRNRFPRQLHLGIMRENKLEILQ